MLLPFKLFVIERSSRSVQLSSINAHAGQVVLLKKRQSINKISLTFWNNEPSQSMFAVSDNSTTA